MSTAFERLGGESALRGIIDDFVGRVFSDPMIGYLFRNVSRDRLLRLEYEHAAEHLGAGVSYSGRPLAQAHAGHAISTGHFDRRRTILMQVLARHGAPPDVIEAWLGEVEAQRGAIVNGASDACSPTGGAA